MRVPNIVVVQSFKLLRYYQTLDNYVGLYISKSTQNKKCVHAVFVLSEHVHYTVVIKRQVL